MNEITILNTTISTDAAGRFSLNDLHKAAGEEKRHQPSDFLRLDQTKALIEELSSGNSRSLTPVNTVLGKGKDQGTFVAWELVYAYAMWISPKFHLHVIRTFHEVEMRKQADLQNFLAKTQGLLEKEQNKNANVKDRIQYLEGKKALFIDDKMNKFAQECALLDREARHEAEQELFELRCRLEGDERPKKSDYNARIKFVKTRCNNVQKRVKMLERLFKGTELEGEMVLCNALEGIVADIEFANHW